MQEWTDSQQAKSKTKINFASDNYAPVHPEVLAYLARVNKNPEPSYGGDSVPMRIPFSCGTAPARTCFP